VQPCGTGRLPVIRRLPHSFLYIIPPDPDALVTAAADEVISMSTTLSVNVLSKHQWRHYIRSDRTQAVFWLPPATPYLPAFRARLIGLRLGVRYKRETEKKQKKRRKVKAENTKQRNHFRVFNKLNSFRQLF